MILTDIALYASIAAAIFGIVSGLLKFFIDYLTAKFSKSSMSIAQQSAQCRFDHERIGIEAAAASKRTEDKISAQNEHIAELLRQNQAQLKYMQDQGHAAELRHQITITKLEAIQQTLKENS